MRILIVSVTTGYGHHSTAAAISEEFKARGDEVVMVDLYEYCSKFLYKAMDKGYLFSTKHMRRQFGFTYSMLESDEHMRKFAAALTNNRRLCIKFARFFHGFSPDAVIATHVLSARVLDILKLRGMLSVPTIGIITDYCIHPFWEDLKNIDYVVTASELLTHSAVKRGISADKILPFGLPTKPAFREKKSKEEARLLLNLENQPTVLVMGGSMGYGNIVDTAEEILQALPELQVLCICGNNSKIRETLSFVSNRNLHVYGFVNNVELFMDAADCIITKPGGLTVTELLVKKLPAILINPIPGHEERNLDFITNNGGAIRTSDMLSISEALYYLFAIPERLTLMSRSLELLAHPDAAEKLCDFVASLVNEKEFQKTVDSKSF